MKSELITPTPTPPKEIDWRKNMVVRSKSLNTIVITNGKHEDKTFSGTVVNSDGAAVFNIGFYSDGWDKDNFHKLTEPVTITFTND